MAIIPVDPELRDRLFTIPHLDLGMQFDVAQLQKEVQTIEEFVGYETTLGNDRVKEKIHTSWKGRTILGMTGDSRSSLRDGKLDGAPDSQRVNHDMVETEIADRVPYMISIIYTLSAQHSPARIMMVTEGASLNWHSHIQDGYTPEWQQIVHVPIIMPEGFVYQVTKRDNLRQTSKVEYRVIDQAQVHENSYPEGRATLFNSYHFHNVYNPNKQQARISIMLNISLASSITSRILQDAVDKYDGVRI